MFTPSSLTDSSSSTSITSAGRGRLRSFQHNCAAPCAIGCALPQTSHTKALMRMGGRPGEKGSRYRTVGSIASRSVSGPRGLFVSYSSVGHAVFTVENLSDHLPSSTARWSKVRCLGRAWPCRSRALRLQLLPEREPSCSISGCERHAQRPALSQRMHRCSTVWLVLQVAQASSR